jgi:hypothetical protein
MIPDRLAWFAMGALFSALLFGWPWHHRFSRYTPRRRQSLPPQGDWMDEAFPLPPPDVMATINRQLDRAIAAEMARRAVQRDHGNGGSSTEKPAIVPRQPVAFTEGRVQRGHGNGGPTTKKPPIVAKPQFPPPQIIREDFLP